MMSHHNQLLSLDANSVECCTMNVHFANDNPKPDKAPYLDAIVWQKHINNKNPIQLKIKATVSKKKNDQKCKIFKSKIKSMFVLAKQVI